MRKSLAIAWLQFRLTMQSKASLATMFAMPAALILIFGLLAGGGGQSSTPKGAVYPLAVVDEDQSLPSSLLLERLGQEENLALTTPTRDQLEKLIADQRVAAALIIPAGFGEAIAAGQGTDLELMTHRGGNLGQGISPVVGRILRQINTDYRLALQLAGSTDATAIRAGLDRVASERENRETAIQVQPLTRDVERSGTSAMSHATLGYTVMAVMMSILMMAGVILYERQKGTWGRLLTAPTDRGSILLGYLLAFFSTGLFQFVLLVLGTRLIFGVEWGPWLPLLAVGSATVLAAVGLGLFLASLVKSYEQQQTVGVILVIATSMLGGLFWPLDLMSTTMQRIGHLTPQAWAMMGLTEVALRGANWANLAWPLTVLLGLGLLFSTAGLIRVRTE